MTLVNEDDLSQPLTTEALRIGTAEEIKKYRGLLDKLGFSEYKTAMLSIRHQEAYDTFIDMSKSSAESLAATLVTELDLLASPTIALGRS